MMPHWIAIIKIIGIAFGIVISLWGLFHQLLVGQVASRLKNITVIEMRMFVMSWVAQGAFISFCGLLPSALLFFYDYEQPSVQMTLLLCGVALILLSVYVLIADFKQHIRPLRIGAILQLIYGLYLLALTLISHPN